MKIYQSRIFENKMKKLSNPEKEILDKEIEKIVDNFSLGEEKKGDLRGVFIHKFKIKATQYLLSYKINNKALELIMLGQHENYYRDLKSYIKKK